MTDHDEENHFYIQQYREVVHFVALPDTVFLDVLDPEGVDLDLNQAESLRIQLGLAIERAKTLEWVENPDGLMEIREKEER